jgi:hypothetical protein
MDVYGREIIHVGVIIIHTASHRNREADWHIHQIFAGDEVPTAGGTRVAKG